MENQYQTRDLYEGAYLYASGQKLIRLRNDSGRFWFLFEDKHACQMLIDSYWHKDGLIDAKTFADAIRSLKDRIFQLKDAYVYGGNNGANFA